MKYKLFTEKYTIHYWILAFDKGSEKWVVSKWLSPILLRSYIKVPGDAGILYRSLPVGLIVGTNSFHKAYLAFGLGSADLPAKKWHRHARIPFFLRQHSHQLFFNFIGTGFRQAYQWSCAQIVWSISRYAGAFKCYSRNLNAPYRIGTQFWQ